jgi:hypothetical protein
MQSAISMTLGDIPADGVLEADQPSSPLLPDEFGPKILGSMSKGIKDMDDNIKILEKSDEDLLSFETSDEALEALAFAGHAGAYTQFGLCTVSLCPGSSQEQINSDRHGFGAPDEIGGSRN